MEGTSPPLDIATFGLRIAATLFFVLLNGFFVAAEFALVKVRAVRIQEIAEQGSSRARVVQHILGHLDRYLSACQLGITVASLILGWLAEPAIAELLLAGAVTVGIGIAPDDAALHAAALAIALAIVTTLHMTVGEQAPKLWAIQRAESTALLAAHPLRAFTMLFQPFILAINGISNAFLRLAGLSPEEITESTVHSAEEIKRLLAASAGSGQISARQHELAQNVLDIIELEVRHIMVPRVDVEFLSLQFPDEQNLRTVRESGHSRLPLCAAGLDTVVGIVHAKEVLSVLAAGGEVDFKKLARKAIFVPDTQSVSRLIAQLQRGRSHVCVVLDEHGTAVGLAFLEDALEEIVGPILDEFDVAEPSLVQLPNGAMEVPGALSLPEAADLLGLDGLGEEADTIGGYVIAKLGRMPRKGDVVRIGPFDVTVSSVTRRRIERLRFATAQGE